MSPQLNNEIRDLQPLVRRMVMRIALVCACALLACALVVAAWAVRAATSPVEAYAITYAGFAFRLPLMPAGAADRVISSPAGVQAVAEGEAQLE